MEKRGIKRMGKEMSFAPAELYVLAGAAGVTDIFGLPNRDAIILLDAECVTKATTSLKEKAYLQVKMELPRFSNN